MLGPVMSTAMDLRCRRYQRQHSLSVFGQCERIAGQMARGRACRHHHGCRNVCGSVAGAGDVNGDGFGDILIGARLYPIQNSTTQEGAAFVFHGSAAGIPTTDTASANSKFFGNLLAEWLGFDVAGVGDVDADGFDDIAIAARVFPGSLDSEGVAHIFRGSPTGIDDASGLAGAYARLNTGQTDGVRRLNRYALSVNGAGDVNGDGFADVIMGAGYFDAPEEDEGAAFIYHGAAAPGTPNEPPVPDAGPDGLFVDLDNSAEQTVFADGSNSFDPPPGSHREPHLDRRRNDTGHAPHFEDLPSLERRS